MYIIMDQFAWNWWCNFGKKRPPHWFANFPVGKCIRQWMRIDLIRIVTKSSLLQWLFTSKNDCQQIYQNTVTVIKFLWCSIMEYMVYYVLGIEESFKKKCKLLVEHIDCLKIKINKLKICEAEGKYYNRSCTCIFLTVGCMWFKLNTHKLHPQ